MPSRAMLSDAMFDSIAVPGQACVVPYLQACQARLYQVMLPGHSYRHYLQSRYTMLLQLRYAAAMCPCYHVTAV
jgi:hypothetical protein